MCCPSLSLEQCASKMYASKRITGAKGLQGSSRTDVLWGGFICQTVQEQHHRRIQRGTTWYWASVPTWASTSYMQTCLEGLGPSSSLCQGSLPRVFGSLVQFEMEHFLSLLEVPGTDHNCEPGVGENPGSEEGRANWPSLI